MNNFVELDIDEGSFEQGFPVRLRIGKDGKTSFRKKVRLPPAPEIPRLYEEWLKKYRDLGDNGDNRQINVPSAQVTRVSVIKDEKEARRRFETYLLDWFSQLPWMELRVSIQDKTQVDGFIRVIIATHNIYLKKLPWHLWELFYNRPHAEFALSGDYATPKERLKRPIKILAIFGGSEGLDLTSDRELITRLSRRGAKVSWLEQPQKEELSDRLWEKNWDILFFAGHTSSREECQTGEIQINNSQSISFDTLRNTLRTAVRNGLKLAIFNSCDGLGLAEELRVIGVPQMIVMREPVPDKVARYFLKYFLEKFSQGHSLYFAVRNARERLEILEDEFPCASWLPVICQNPAAHPLVWAKPLVKKLNKWVVTGIAIALIFAGNYILENFLKNNNIPPQSISRNSQANPTPPTLEETLPDLGENFSWGEKILINSNPLKQEGVNNFGINNSYEQSIKLFSQSLEVNQNDPETLIYLNNAVAMEPSEINQLPVSNIDYARTCILDNKKPLKIAVIAPSFSNTSNKINEELLQGVAQAQNEINLNCGINRRLLQIVIVDDGDKDNISSKVAKSLADEKDILAVVGHYSSGASAKAGEIYQEKQMVLVSPTSTAVRNTNNREYGMKLNKYLFRTSSNDEILVKNLVNYIVKLGKKKVTIVYDSESTVYSENFKKELETQLKSKQVELINFEECNLFNNANFNKCVERAKETVSVMAIIPTSRSFDKALDILDIGKDSNLIFISGDTMDRDRVKEKARNLIFAVSWFQNKLPSNKTQFESNALELWGINKISWRSAMSYDATMAIIEGLRNMGNNPTREGLQQALSANGFSAPGAAGKVEFDQNGDRRITEENKDKIGVLVQLKCDTNTPNNCDFVRVPQQ
ncbi:MAG: ABC transporter substrate-binding protein [Cyanobacteria bacterium J06633_8]